MYTAFRRKYDIHSLSKGNMTSILLIKTDTVNVKSYQTLCKVTCVNSSTVNVSRTCRRKLLIFRRNFCTVTRNSILARSQNTVVCDIIISSSTLLAHRMLSRNVMNIECKSYEICKRSSRFYTAVRSVTFSSLCEMTQTVRKCQRCFC